MIIFHPEYPKAQTPSGQAGHLYHKSHVSGHILGPAEAIIPATAVGKPCCHIQWLFMRYIIVLCPVATVYHSCVVIYLLYRYCHPPCSFVIQWLRFITDVNRWLYVWCTVYRMINADGFVLVCLVTILSGFNGLTLSNDSYLYQCCFTGTGEIIWSNPDG